MTVSRYNGRVYNLSREHSFTLWLFLSVTIHVLLAALIVISHSARKSIFYTPAYEVELLPRTEVIIPEEARPKKEVSPLEKPEKEKIRPKARKGKKPTVIAKIKKDSHRPDDAVAKIREKIAAEEAVENIRKRVKEKETTSSGKIKIAARPPTKVLDYDELNAELKAYYDKISRMITEAWSLPEALRNKGFKTILSIHIRRDGTIESLWIEEGSGNKFYDESTLRAISKVTPLPPLPKGWKEEAIDLGFRF